MIHWIVSRQAAFRLAGLRTGRRDLLEAIPASGGILSIAEWDGIEAVLPSEAGTAGQQVAVYGGHPFLEAVKRQRPEWSGGIFHDPDLLSGQAVIRAIGPLALNSHSSLMCLREAREMVLAGESLFLRPDRADKTFAGRVFTRKDLDLLPDDPDLAVIASAPREIFAEYRFVVVDREVVTGSQYARAGKLDVRVDVDPACRAVAKQAACLYAPVPAYVCDVAETPEGPRVVEYNSFSAAGLYACDASAIADALAQHFEPPAA